MSYNHLNKGAFDGGPKTTDTIDLYGVPTIEVKLTATDPFWRKVADRVGMILLMPSLGMIAIHFLNSPRLQADWSGLGVDLMVVGGFLLWLTHMIRKVERHVKFTPQALLVKRRRLLFGSYWEEYELNQPVRLTMLLHDRALQEREENEFRRAKASMSGKALRTESLYQNSFHICVEHYGQRNDIITVYGRKEATAILTRLKACLEINKARAGRSASTATEPGQQWKSMPGSLPALPAPERVSNLH